MLVNIDCGHGSETPGKRTPPMLAAVDINGDGTTDIKKGEQYREHYANVGVAGYLVEELERCGIKTLRTGWDDENAKDDPDMSLTARQKAIALAGCDYSVSIHFNAAGDGKTFNTAKGVSVYIHNQHSGQSEKLAQVVLKHLLSGTKQNNRGVNKQALAMCNCDAVDTKAAILIELAFMTNEEEAKMMASEAFWKKSAQEICKGICEYTGIRYIEEKKVIYKVQVGAFSDEAKAEALKKKLMAAGYDAIVIEA